ncbi:hypothetical protein G9444_6351 [Rhodococcus erythropolis]|uniref:Uncharacterized protein n=1 Tax=Rhodococcus erythropolis TaxID=1833 RepID=A0A6G9D364_RHOER|nr:hypothetical protein G9444_6351 [Rhodococcus erythropolis]
MVERRIVRTLGKLTPIAMAAAIAITAPGLAAADAPRGPDVSSWQHVDGTGIDWFQVKASGHEFAMVKATESLNYVNPYFIQDCLVMRAAGVSRGPTTTQTFASPPKPRPPSIRRSSWVSTDLVTSRPFWISRTRRDCPPGRSSTGLIAT